MATVDILPAFDYEWAQLGAVEAIDENQWRAGWAFIGSVPPSVEQFNKFGQIFDQKSNYLYGQLKTIYDLTGVVPGAAVLSSLRDALRGTGLFQTAVAGTSNTGVATNEFVQNAIAAQYSGVVGTSRNLRAIQLAAAANLTVTATEVTLKSAVGGPGVTRANYNRTLNSAVVGAAGMDVGLAPVSGWVAIYAIYNPATNTDSILGVDATAAPAPEVYGGSNMPAGYTHSCLIGVWPTTAARLLDRARQLDRDVYFFKSVLSILAPTGAFTSLSLATAVPRNATRWRGNGAMNHSAGIAGLSFAVCPTVDGQGFPGYVAIQTTNGIAGNIVGGTIPDSPIFTAQTTFYAFSAPAANSSLTLNCYGYTF
jgi:hypothetical protein